jgi:hypothetical protein
MVCSKGVPSSKRMITIVAFLLMATGFIANLFFNLTIDEFIYDSMKWIVIGGLGFTASEQFAKGNTTITTRMGKNAPEIVTTTKNSTNGENGNPDDYDEEDPANSGNIEHVEGADEVNEQEEVIPKPKKKKKKGL